ncbi:conserved hypothetical protein [Helicobacter bizzozeronii CCUG 35545]|nr:conserved hypothetical protein [Helicobacter bizzozeronii CCUG 35545]
MRRQKFFKFDIDGKHAFAYLHDRRSDRVDDPIDGLADKFEDVVNKCLRWILDIDLELLTTDIGDFKNNIQVGFQFKDLESGLAEDKNVLSPFNVGSGVSYLAKILIIALSLKENDIFIIENPEIHLHPKAIANLASFFSRLVSNKRVQLIIETHSAYFLHRLRYEVYKYHRQDLQDVTGYCLSKDDVRFFYKDQQHREFKLIDIDANGSPIDSSGKSIRFPTGFLDVSVQELLEMM